jgi:glycosyltransferase involved in cell wall biosynthesis
MRILLVSNDYPFGRRLRIGGGGSHVFYLAMGLVQSGADVSLITYDGASKEHSPLDHFQNFSLLPYIDRRGIDRTVTERALEACRLKTPDVIHGHHFDGGKLGLTLAAAFNRPMVLTMHKPPKSSGDAYSASDPNYMRRYDYALWHQLGTDQRIRAHIAYSKVYEQENRDIGVPDTRIEPISHGVPVSFLCDKARAASRSARLSLPSKAHIVLCPLRPEKPGIRTFIDAAVLLRKRYTNDRFYFIVTGDPRRGPIEACAAATRHVSEARRLGLSDSVMVFRAYWLRQMWSIISGSSVCVLPSEREGLSITALEAMALSTPLVASEVVGLNEVIVDGITGLLATQGKPEEFADRIARILFDVELRRRLVEQAKARVEECFSSARMVDRHIEVYRKVIAQWRILQKCQPG